MKKILVLILLALSFITCDRGPIDGGSYALRFAPRECKYAWITPGVTSDTFRYRSGINIEGAPIPINKFRLSIKTYDIISEEGRLNKEEFNVYMNQYLLCPYYVLSNENATRFPMTEEMIRIDYEKTVRRFSKTKSSDGMDYMNLIILEYRTTGVKEFVIYSKDATLFGKQPGASLNDYFEIVEFDPPFIISSTTTRLLYGKSNYNDHPKDISKWLSLSPTAQPCIIFKLKSIPPELPVEITLGVKIVTTEGNVIEAESTKFNLIK